MSILRALEEQIDWGTPKTKEAAQFAKYYHKGQTRKEFGGTVDYFWGHVYQVYRILYKQIGVQEETVLVSALLHDVLEDTDCPRKLIQEKFGKAVLENVEYLTKSKGQNFSAYAKKLMTEGKSAVILIKLADRYHNLTTILRLDDNHDNNAWIQKKVRQTEKDILYYIPEVLVRFEQQGDIKWQQEIQELYELVKKQNEYVRQEVKKREL
ncbi:MAG: HD domain-containing protein [Lachnospiraceae bacterium]